MAIIVSRMVGVDTTANQPAALAVNRLYLSTTAGDALYLPLFDDGAAWQPWRANISIPLFTAEGASVVARNFVPGNLAAYQPFGGANNLGKQSLSFYRFRQARLYARANVTALNGITLKVRDLTNGQNIGAIATIATGAWTDYLGAWTALNAATYVGDAFFEVQGQSIANVADHADFGTITLELR